jgi:hypothetical protein
VSGPATESVLADMQREITRLTPAAKYDPAMREARAEFNQTVRRYQILIDELAQRHLRLLRLRDSEAHKILNDISPALFDVPRSTQEAINALFGVQRPRPFPVPGEIAEPEFADVVGYRQATRAFLAEVQKLDNVRSRIDSVLAFESYHQEDKNQALIFALFSRIGALEDRLAELERPPISKRGKSR